MYLLRHVAFRPHLSMSLALSKSANDFVRLPSGISLREAVFKILKVDLLHGFLERSLFCKTGS